MSATVMDFESFYGYVDSQISRIERYNQEPEVEKFTIFFIKAREDEIIEIERLLEVNLRQSDVVFLKDDYTFISLANTDRMGAMHIEEMVKEFFPHPPIMAYVTYNEDGETKDELFQNLSDICDSEYQLDFEDFLR